MASPLFTWSNSDIDAPFYSLLRCYKHKKTLKCPNSEVCDKISRIPVARNFKYFISTKGAFTITKFLSIFFLKLNHDLEFQMYSFDQYLSKVVVILPHVLIFFRWIEKYTFFFLCWWNRLRNMKIYGRIYLWEFMVLGVH